MDARASLRISAALAAALAAAAARPAAARAAAPAQDPPPVAVEGTVASRAGDPLAEANVFLLETLDGALSDARGRFRFETRHRGAATLVVLRRGYLELRQPVTLPLADPLALVLDARPVALAPLEVAAGRVLATAEPDAALGALEVVTTPGAAADVYRAIQTFPGLQAVDEGAGLFVRGGSPEETRVFLDEAVVLAPYRYESPTGGFFGTFDPFQLDGIVFSTGGFGARHGDALSGIADLHTLGRPSRTGGGASASLAALSGTLALALPHGLGVRGAATRSHTGLMFDVNGTSTDFTNVPEGRDLSGGVTWAYRPAGELRAFGMDQWSRLGVVVEDPSFTGAYEADERHDLYVASWRDTFERVAPVASVSTAGTESTRELGAFRLRTAERLSQAHARVAFDPRPLWTLTFGGDVERRRSSFTGTVPAQGHDIAPGARRTVVASTVTGTRHALFGEADWRAANALRLTAGLRTDRSTLSRERTWDPRLAAALRLLDGVTLTAAWGVYHQVPSPLAYEPETGDPTLPPMRAVHRIAGALLEREGLLLRVELYSKRYRDLAQQTRDYAIAGGGRGTSRGADVFARYTRAPGLDLRLAYSFVDAERTDPDTRERARSPYDITHTVAAVVDRTFGSRWRVGAAYRYATGRPFTPVIGAVPDTARAGVWVPQYGTSFGERLPAFHRLDLAGSALHSFWPGNLTVFFVGVSNALDRENVYGYRYSADYGERTAERSQFERAVYFGVSLTF